MRIFFVLVAVCGVFVAALLLGAGIGSSQLTRRLGWWQILLWAICLIAPPLVLHRMSVRYQARISRLPAEFIDLRAYEIGALSALPVAYAAGFVLGALPFPFALARRRDRKPGDVPEDEPNEPANPPRG